MNISLTQFLICHQKRSKEVLFLLMVEKVKDFIVSFINLNNREPMNSEIIDNLRDKIDIPILQKIIDEQKSIEIIIGN